MCDGKTCPMLWFSSMITKILVMAVSRAGVLAGFAAVAAAAGRDSNRSRRRRSSNHIRRRGDSRGPVTIHTIRGAAVERMCVGAVLAIETRRIARGAPGMRCGGCPRGWAPDASLYLDLYGADRSQTARRSTFARATRAGAVSGNGFKISRRSSSRPFSELLIDACQVPFHRLLTHEQRLGDPRVDHSPGRQLRHSPLGRGEGIGTHKSQTARPRPGGAELPGGSVDEGLGSAAEGQIGSSAESTQRLVLPALR